MAGYDITMRYLTDRHPEQWATWLLGCRPDTCQLLQTTLPQIEREAGLNILSLDEIRDGDDGIWPATASQ